MQVLFFVLIIINDSIHNSIYIIVNNSFIIYIKRFKNKCYKYKYKIARIIEHFWVRTKINIHCQIIATKMFTTTNKYANKKPKQWFDPPSPLDITHTFPNIVHFFPIVKFKHQNNSLHLHLNKLINPTHFQNHDDPHYYNTPYSSPIIHLIPQIDQIYHIYIPIQSCVYAHAYIITRITYPM